jgi:uncharacterized membrane protein
MRFFEYLYFRMYNAYSEKNESPAFRATMYIALLLFVIVLISVIYLEKLLVIGNIFPESSVIVIKRSYH